MDDRILRAELMRLENEGAEMHAASAPEPVLPPTSARREVAYTPIPAEELERLKAVTRRAGLELINDGAVYRIKRGRDFMIWTLETSPLMSEERGGGEAYAYMEAIRRFCEP